eukprot:SAG31_NODE_1054_length_10140_cov_4.264316_16_plen_90_part_00
MQALIKKGPHKLPPIVPSKPVPPDLFGGELPTATLARELDLLKSEQHMEPDEPMHEDWPKIPAMTIPGTVQGSEANAESSSPVTLGSLT